MLVAAKRKDKSLICFLLFLCLFFQSCAKFKKIEGNVGLKKIYNKKNECQIEYTYMIIGGKEVKHGIYKEVKEIFAPRAGKEILVTEINYSFGKKEGAFEKFYIKLETNKKFPVIQSFYKNDLLEGEEKIFSYEYLRSDMFYYYLNLKSTFKKGKPHGLTESFNHKGTRTSSTLYENGMRNGISIEYNFGDLIFKKFYYLNDILLKIEYFDKLGGVHSSIEYKNDKPFEGVEFSNRNNINGFYDKITYKNGKIIKIENNFNFYGESVQDALDKRDEHFQKSKTNQIDFSKAINNSIKLKHELGLNFILVPPGDFVIGGPVAFESKVKPEMKINMSVQEGFYLSETEVTQEVWEKIMHENPSNDKGTNKPVTDITWNEANEFIKKINVQYKSVFRLPTEVEWEYACRAGSNELYYDNNLSEIAVFMGGNDLFGHKYHVKNVKTKKPNQWGMYDMLGNVYEWCISDYIEYKEYNNTNRIISNGDNKIIRGGAYSHKSTFLIMSDRQFQEKNYKNHNLGFRLLLEIKKQESNTTENK